jgi:hypothetical protein
VLRYIRLPVKPKNENFALRRQKTLHPARGFGFIPPCRSRFPTPRAAG